MSVNTSDEIASEPEENSDDEQKEEVVYITEGELVKIESSFEDRTEQVRWMTSLFSLVAAS